MQTVIDNEKFKYLKLAYYNLAKIAIDNIDKFNSDEQKIIVEVAENHEFYITRNKLKNDLIDNDFITKMQEIIKNQLAVSIHNAKILAQYEK